MTAPGCPLYPTPGTTGLFYPSPDGQYSCLNTPLYYRDVVGVPASFAHEVAAGLGNLALLLLEVALYLAYWLVLLVFAATVVYAQVRPTRFGGWLAGLAEPKLYVYRPGP